MLKKIYKLVPERLKKRLSTSPLSQILLKYPLGNFLVANTLQIEITKRCNLRCEMCKGIFESQELINSEDKKEKIDLSPVEFRYILKKVPDRSHINFTGGGEPFLHPQFKKILKIAKKADKKIVMTSNGTLLNKELAKYLVDLNIDNITFSIDGATAETFEDIRKGADFEKVLQNMRRLIEIRKRKNSSYPQIRINFMGMRKNIEEFPRLVEMAGELGVSGVRILHPIPLDKEIEQQHLHNYPALFNKIRTKAKELAGKYGLNLILPPIKPRSRVCLAPLRGVMIDVKGCVKPCGLFSGNKTELSGEEDVNKKMHYMGESIELSTDLLNLGNIFQEDFDYSQIREKCSILSNKLRNRVKVEKNKTWTPKYYKNLIKKQKKPKSPFDICKICPIRLGVGC